MGTAKDEAKTVESSASRYCRKCDYNLAHLTANRCPECGREFDPNNPKTTRRKRRKPALRWLFRIAAMILLPAIIYSSFLGWLYKGWHREQIAIASLNYPLANIQTKDVMPWATRIIPARFRFIQQRVVGVDFLSAEAANLTPLKDFTELTYVRAYGQWITDDYVDAILKCSRLKNLVLWYTSLTDAGAIRLGQLRSLESLSLIGNANLSSRMMSVLEALPHLKSLYLENMEIKDDGFDHLRGCHELTFLRLSALGVSQTDVDAIASMPKLKELELDSCNLDDAMVEKISRLPLERLMLWYTFGGENHVTNAAVPSLERMSHLKELDLTNTNISSAGIAELRAKLPQCEIAR